MDLDVVALDALAGIFEGDHGGVGNNISFVVVLVIVSVLWWSCHQSSFSLWTTLGMSWRLVVVVMLTILIVDISAIDEVCVP